MKKTFQILMLSIMAIVLSFAVACGETSISVDKTEIQLLVGEEQVIIATVEGGGEVSFTSNDSSIASVDNDGKVTANKAGQTEIVVTESKGQKTVECTVVVKQPVNGVAFNETTKTINVNESFDTAITFEPADSSNKNVSYSSSDLSVAIVNQNGKVTGIKSGTATITVTTEDGGKTATCVITVKQPVISVELNASSLSIEVGDEQTLTATLIPENADNKNYTFSSSDETVATVDENGKVVAIARGTAIITVTTEDGAKTATCEVKVIKAVESVEFNQDALLLLSDTTTTLTVNILPTDADNKNVMFSSSDETVATVDEEGKVTAIAKGTATITVTTEDGEKTDTIEITVINELLPTYMAVGQSIDCFDGYTYIVDSGDALKIEDNKVKAIQAGTARVNVTATDFDRIFDIVVIDFGNTRGSTFDLATDTSLWNYRNYSGDAETDISIEIENNVQAVGASLPASVTTPLEYNALKYTRENNDGQYRVTTGNMMYLRPEIISLAKAIGYKYLSFSIFVPDDPEGEDATHFVVYNCNEDGSLKYYKSDSKAILDTQNGARWKRYYFNLSDAKFYEDAGIGFGMYGKTMYLAQVEFTGADISEYAKDFITASTTVGKSNDVISEELIGKMFTPTCNTSTLTYGVGGGKETNIGGNDYIKLDKNGYYGSYYLTYNSIKISSEWIQAAKKLGYNVIGIFILKNDTTNPLSGKAGYIKQGADGKCYGMSSTSNGQWTGANTGFVSIDISGFEEGESLIVACEGASVSITGLTFRNYDGKNGIAAPSLIYANFSENMG